MTPVRSVEEYIAGFPDDVQVVLRTLRAMMREELPGAEETISYGIPTYKRDGKYVVYFAGFKKHVSVFPASDALVDALPETAKFRTGKGTLQFPLAKPLPMELIREVVAYLKAQHSERGNKRGDQRVPRS